MDARFMTIICLIIICVCAVFGSVCMCVYVHVCMSVGRMNYLYADCTIVCACVNGHIAYLSNYDQNLLAKTYSKAIKNSSYSCLHHRHNAKQTCGLA